MPFTNQEHRLRPDMMIPGDRCEREYQYIMDEWAKSGRWTTIDNLATRLFPDAYERAFFLAFLVFMHKHGFKYEDEQCAKNGDIFGRVA